VHITPLASSSAGNSTLVEHEAGRAVLLDAGLTLKQLRAAIGYRVTGLEAALITHSHADHAKGVPELLKAGVTCAMRAETAEALGVAGHHRVRILAPQDGETTRAPYAFGPWAVIPFDVQHDVPNLGFVLATRKHRLLYLTDTPFSRYKFEGLTHIVIEANYSLDILKRKVADGVLSDVLAARIVRSHLGLERAIELLKANDLSKVTEIWLTHLSNSNSHAEEFQAAVERATGIPTSVAGEGVRA